MKQPYTLKKSLGQHFLTDENICRKIIAEIPTTPTAQILEVGPGAGALTKYLLAASLKDYKAVELDEEKVNYLLQCLPLLKGRLIHRDFLKMEPPFTDNFTVVGNFPYNISGPILFKILDWEPQVDCVVGMFQKEVARRITALSGNKTYGILSVLLQAFYQVEYLFEVSPSCFSPPPKVTSAVVRLIRTDNPYHINNRSGFRKMVKTAFAQRRKTLHNALKPLTAGKKLPEEFATLRAEQLSVADFVKLFHTCFDF